MELNASSKSDTRVNLQSAENGHHESTSHINKDYLKEAECSKTSINKEPSGLGKDKKKVMLLTYLYFLQGIPLGLSASMPFLLSARGVSYSDQGTFSFAIWPFSLKILWAPLVDSLYVKRFGRRKTWLVPIQFLMALFLFTCAERIQTLIDSGSTNADIIFLTFVFGSFVTLAATQDIAVDAWAITMLSRKNISWQATCNLTGQSIGYFFGNIIFIVLESKKFSNEYLRPIFGLASQDHGIITLKMFMYGFGAVFTFTTFVLIFLVKEENLKSVDNIETEDQKHLHLLKTYKTIWKMISLPRVKELAFILLTSRIGWSTDSVLFLKMIELGVSKETICLLTIPLIPITVFFPLVLKALINKYTDGQQALIIYRKCIPFKLTMVLICCTFIYFIPNYQNSAGEYEYDFYLMCLLIFGVSTLIDLTRSMTMMSFMARVSDESIGGTYMTFLNTISNLGAKYPATAALYLINWLTTKVCYYDADDISNRNSTMSSVSISKLEENTCSSTYKSKECEKAGGSCLTILDAFYFLTIFFVAVGLVWLLVFKRLFTKLNNSKKSEWELFKNSPQTIPLG